MEEDIYQNEEDDQTFFDKPKKSKLSAVFLYQLILCLAVMAVMGGIKFMVPDKFAEVKEQISYALKGDDFKKGIQNICRHIIDSINNIKPLNGDSEQDSQQSSQESSSQSDGQNVSNADNQVNQTEQPESSANNAVKEVNCTSYILPLSGQITSPFGVREDPIKEDGQSEVHEGVDIGAPEGADIKAIGDGIVETVSSSDKSGNYLLIDHQNGIISLYAHCSQILVNSGDNVKQGQVIAKVGHTGEATGPHLHLGVKQNGVFINPVQILPQLK